jgi:catechol 2,3-dioxygenase
MNMFADREQSIRGSVSGPRIGHVNLRVADLIRATSFYCDVLGLSVSYYGPSIGVPTVFLTFGAYHHHIALNWFYSDSDRPKHLNLGGLHHLAILHPDEVSLARAVTRLLEHGDLIDDARDHGWTLSVYLRDPDGNGIELYYDRPQTQWFDSLGELMIKSEPFDVRKWLKDVWASTAKSAQGKTRTHSQAVDRVNLNM